MQKYLLLFLVADLHAAEPVLRLRKLARATELVKQPANDGMRAFPLIVELDDVQNLTDAYGAIAVDEVLIALTTEIANTVGQSHGQLISRWSSHRCYVDAGGRRRPNALRLVRTNVRLVHRKRLRQWRILVNGRLDQWRRDLAQRRSPT